MKKSRPTTLLPKPFDWIEIPKKNYEIAKYPTTNAQFRKFIKDDGYNQQKWWTQQGWEYRERGSWTQPHYWEDSKFNGDTQPVVGVSWFEALAFCMWLSDRIDEKIMLPTEQQWKFAAQGDDKYNYPWGNDWNRDFCNNDVGKTGIGKTTPVTQYEGKGDSPFGVVDMVGNVWEWCLTDSKNNTDYARSITNNRIICGGSWFDHNGIRFRIAFRDWNSPNIRTHNYIGFRIARFN